MAEVAVSGNDTVQINGRLFTSFANGSNAKLTYDEDLIKMSSGKNGNTVIAANAAGRRGMFVIRLIRGSADDLFLNSLLQQQDQGLQAFTLLNGQFVKLIGNGQGVQRNDTYKMISGAFKKRPGADSNADADTEQSLVEYPIEFARVSRQPF